MMDPCWTAKQSAASKEELCAHLRACNDSFVPPLSEQTDLSAYAAKIVQNAETFEAWSGDELVGVVAAYLNDRERAVGHITNVSVTDSFRGRGIAAALLKSCRVRAERDSFGALTLEVHRDNRRARTLYERLGFRIDGDSSDRVKMRLDLVPPTRADVGRGEKP